MFLCVSIVKDTEMVLIKRLTNRTLKPCCLNGIMGKNNTLFILTLLFDASKRWNPSESPQSSVKIKIMSFFISINYFMLLWTGWVKVFSPMIFISKKIVTNMKFAFTNVLFRHNLACVMIKKWLRFKRVITVRLVYLINIFYLKQRS